MSRPYKLLGVWGAKPPNNNDKAKILAELAELFEIALNNIVPIFIMAGVGFAIGKGLGVDPKPIGMVIFYALSPFLVFYLLYTSDVSGGEFLRLGAATIAFQLSMAVLAFLFARWRKATPVERANLMLAAFSLNAGNYGLSLVSFAFDATVLSRAAAVFAVNVILNYTMGIYVASNGRSSPLVALGSVFKTPTVYGVVAAFVLRGLEIDLPLFLLRPAERLGDAAIPMMLIMLGLQLGRFAAIRKPGLVVGGVTIKMLIAPLVGVLLAVVFGLFGPARAAFITQVSMPTAVLTIVFSSQYDLDSDLTLNLVMLSTLVSPITLSVILFILR